MSESAKKSGRYLTAVTDRNAISVSIAWPTSGGIRLGMAGSVDESLLNGASAQMVSKRPAQCSATSLL